MKTQPRPDNWEIPTLNLEESKTSLQKPLNRNKKIGKRQCRKGMVNCAEYLLRAEKKVTNGCNNEITGYLYRKGRHNLGHIIE